MSTTVPDLTFHAFAQPALAQLEVDIHAYLAGKDLPDPLAAACLYAMTNGGKRVRPLLVASSFTSITAYAQAITDAQARLPNTIRGAMLAVELLHGYSLVHDDLPCMDDDDLRRGRPTTHIAFGEAAALLAGDMLQNLAFEVFAEPMFFEAHDIALSHRLLTTFAPAARRMIMGQMLDLNGEHRDLSQAGLEAIHRDKTGALIAASVRMGALCAHADAATLTAVTTFAEHIGLAFQVQDDILDVTADTTQLGKPAGSDEKLAKSTYVKLLGVKGAQDYAESLFAQAHTALDRVLPANSLLHQLANWLWQRQK
ncbi:farnesyl-diphosphate synthase [Moraxella atlantae]|uniref:Farnesyl-diphosphate synthase n=1 Tax=Faucicola atlantae TaxID=34059 RepID=A0A1B8QBP7_9GAMM|nr:farnesyl diphosphate synthase [Moraxella atlantae]OBX77111.1 farnesyl-diphosphate synthase [Moraxella atlantae]